MAAGALYYQRMLRLIALVVLSLYSQCLAAERVPAWLIRLPESTATVFIAETTASAFHRFDRAGDGVTKVREDYMSIGLGGVGKERTGDQRTPLGIYVVTEQLDTTRMHEKYGVTAFPLDYPNAWDRRLGRSGDGIWVHGVDARGGRRPPQDTDGCIALPNDDLLALEAGFAANVTPVLIGTELAWSERDAVLETRRALEQAVGRWADALEQGDMYAYLDSYAAEFEHWGMSRDDWTSFSLQTVARRPITAVEISDLLILADPAEAGLYLSRFRLEVREGEARNVITMRRLYWRRSESGAFRIVAQDSG
jgi:hypothetical protein